MHIGTFLIVSSLVVSSILFVFNCIILVLKKEYPKALDILFYASGLLIAFSVVLLFTAFLTDRFDFSYVYNYSSKDLHVIYKAAAFWAGQEGTFLLWVFFLFIIGAIIKRIKDDFSDIVSSVIILTQIFLLILLFKHSPFESIWQTNINILPNQIPVDGSGLNPLLQNPWMIIHPPVLFLGYASASVPFAYAIAGLIRNDYSDWVLKTYKWVVFCVASLGIGIFLGAYWAYKVLGWGGYWGWDPVENSSLIPWLTMIALMHGLILQKKKDLLIKTNLFLAVISLVLVFYATFLTRSGILSDFSVHSFSGLESNSWLLLYIFIFFIVGISLLLIRCRNIKTVPFEDKILSEINIVNYGIILLSFYSFFVLIGTSMPVISQIFLTNASAVTVKFYNGISKPFGILILATIIIAGIYRTPKKRRFISLIIISFLSLVCGVFFNLFYTSDLSSYILSILAFFIIIQHVPEIVMQRSSYSAASRLAHLGLGLLILGIISSNLHSYSIQKILIKNIESEIGSIKLIFKGLEKPGLDKLKFEYLKNKKVNEIQTPYYICEKMDTIIREPYVDYGFFKDIYISPVEYKGSPGGIEKKTGADGKLKKLGVNTIVHPDAVIVEVSFKRFVWLVWLGTILISFGGIFAVKNSLRKVISSGGYS
ncbi:MAG: cytochrome c biogenesis protein CcsA [Spirochaetes bacterium]|nr:cytochrome c biogenesis protein CcsA [Spirochaetota bacterium]